MNLLKLFTLAALLVSPALAQEPPKRPFITGISHVRLWATDVHKSQDFYRQILGLKTGTAFCTGKASPCFTVNDHQQIELAQVTSAEPKDLLAEIAFTTTDIEGMHTYLAAHQITVSPITRDPDGVRHFELHDPENNPIAFVQLPSARFFTPAHEQTSNHLLHAGFIVHDMDKENKFYMDLLGFRIYWRGGFKDDGLDWYELQVSEGDNWIEYMLNIPANADKKERGVQNHFSFGVNKIDFAVSALKANGLRKMDGPEVGRDGKQGLDVYDPDGSRVEYMEFTPTKEPCCHAYTAPHAKP